MQIYYGLTISEFVGLVIGGITLVVLLVYYGISAIIRAWKSRRTKRAPDALHSYNTRNIRPPKYAPGDKRGKNARR